jgi:hypothetical protein
MSTYEHFIFRKLQLTVWRLWVTITSVTYGEKWEDLCLLAHTGWPTILALRSPIKSSLKLSQQIGLSNDSPREALKNPEVHPFKIMTMQKLKEFACVNRVQYFRQFQEFYAANGRDIRDVNVFQR